MKPNTNTGSSAWRRLAVTLGVVAASGISAPVAPASAQAAAQPGGGGQPVQQGSAYRPQGLSLRNVLGNVPMSAADSAVQTIVARLDFESYKSLIRGLTQFGDRQQGTPRNEQASDWIEQQLRGWGYQTERLHYDYSFNDSTAPGGRRTEPREEVYATKVGSTVPSEMYIVSGHMDGRGGGQAANDDGSGTALVMEIARVLASSDVRTNRSVRFALWNNEETGLNGATAYAEQRAPL